MCKCAAVRFSMAFYNEIPRLSLISVWMIIFCLRNAKCNEWKMWQRKRNFHSTWLEWAAFKALYNMITLFIYLFFISMQHISPWIQLIRMNFDLSSHNSSGSNSSHTVGWIVMLEHVKVHLLGITTHNSVHKLLLQHHFTISATILSHGSFGFRRNFSVWLVCVGTLLKIGSMNKTICSTTHQFDANDGSL